MPLFPGCQREDKNYDNGAREADKLVHPCYGLPDGPQSYIQDGDEEQECKGGRRYDSQPLADPNYRAHGIGSFSRREMISQYMTFWYPMSKKIRRTLGAVPQ